MRLIGLEIEAGVNPEEILALEEPVIIQKSYENAQSMAVSQARAVELQPSARASTSSVAAGACYPSHQAKEAGPVTVQCMNSTQDSTILIFLETVM